MSWNVECMYVFYAWSSYVKNELALSIGDCNECNCNGMLGKPCYRVVVAGFVMGCNCSWNVVCVYSGLGKVT